MPTSHAGIDRVELGSRPAVGEHRPLRGFVDEDHDRPRAPLALHAHVDARVREGLRERIALGIRPDASDEAHRRSSARQPRRHWRRCRLVRA